MGDELVWPSKKCGGRRRSLPRVRRRDLTQHDLLRSIFCCAKLEHAGRPGAKSDVGVDFSRRRGCRLAGRRPLAGDAWLRGAGIRSAQCRKVDLLELVWSDVLRIYDRDAALAWLFGVNRCSAIAVRSI